MDSVHAQRRADRLLRETRDHKRVSRQQRELARRKRQALDELIASCAKRGITITINTQPQGGHGGNHADQDQAV